MKAKIESNLIWRILGSVLKLIFISLLHYEGKFGGKWMALEYREKVQDLRWFTFNAAMV